MSPSCSSSSSSLRPVPGSAAVLVALRQRMEAQGLDALVIPSEDAHQSEYVSLKDRRREFMCGFTGSAGTAVVTPDQALLWTDGRYFLQAKQQLGPEWDLMKALEEGVPTVEVWLAKHLHETKGGGVVGVNGLLLNMAQARSWKLAFDPRNVSLKILDVDLVDEVWGAAQPPAPDAPVRVHPLIYAGQDVPAKLENLRKRLLEKSASALLLSALDEVAWLYNIRGSDIQYNPVVYAYSVVTDQEAVLFIDGEKLGEDVKEHLATAGVTVLPYTAITTYLKESLLPSLQAQEDTPPPPPPQQQQAQATTRKKKVVMMDPNQVSLALGSLIPTECIIEGPSPITLAKAIKNHAELRGMRQAHIRDGVALTSFLAWLEKAMEGGKEAPAEVRGGLSWYEGKEGRRKGGREGRRRRRRRRRKGRRGGGKKKKKNNK
ncbi:aminopeptidase p1, partial [Nannochloropsis oceanica]